MNNVFSYGPDSTPASFGLFGGEIVTSGTINFDFYYLVFFEDTTISSATLGQGWVGSLDGVEFKAGTSLAIRGTSLTASGGVIVYRTKGL